MNLENMSNPEIERIAGYDFLKIHDFMKEKRAEGLIVTATDMITHRCLHVNDLQVVDRGGGWTGSNWLGLNFLNLWVDSFTGGFNYFEQLIEVVQKDLFIPNFEYKLRAPNGDLRRYVSDYYYVDNYLGSPARLCVSKPGNWEVA
jgi:hypothetical protein